MFMEVRCCCDAQKLLGYFDVAEPRKNQGSVSFRWYERQGCLSMADVLNFVSAPTARVVNLPLSEISIDGKRYIAIKADHMELDELRKIPGFMELGKRLDRWRA